MSNEPFRAQIEALIAAGHGVGAIAEALEIPAATVRAVAGVATEDDAADMMVVMKSIAHDRSVPAGVRAKVATYIHEEAKGRNEKNAAGAAALVPVLELASRLASLSRSARPARLAKPVTQLEPEKLEAPTEKTPLPEASV